MLQIIWNDTLLCLNKSLFKTKSSKSYFKIHLVANSSELVPIVRSILLVFGKNSSCLVVMFNDLFSSVDENLSGRCYNVFGNSVIIETFGKHRSKEDIFFCYLRKLWTKLWKIYTGVFKLCRALCIERSTLDTILLIGQLKKQPTGLEPQSRSEIKALFNHNYRNSKLSNAFIIRVHTNCHISLNTQSFGDFEPHWSINVWAS